MQMSWLTISFDGTGATYEKLRAPAKFDEAVAKIRRFHEIKKEKGSVKPVVRIQGIWPAIEENPEKYIDTIEPIVDEVSVISLLDYLRYDEQYEYGENFKCPVRFQRLVIGSVGRAFKSNNNKKNQNTNSDSKTESIYNIWNGPKMTDIRKTHLRAEGTKTYEPCKVCYLARKTTTKPYKVGRRTIELEELVGREMAIGK